MFAAVFSLDTASALIGFAFGVVVAAGTAVWWEARRREALRREIELQSRHLIEAKEAELAESGRQLERARRETAAFEIRFEAGQNLIAEQRALFAQSLDRARDDQRRAVEDLREAFKALSVDALQQTQPEFLRLATATLAQFQESARSDLARRQDMIEHLVKPLEEHLKTYHQTLTQTHQYQAAALAEVQKQVEHLAGQSQVLSRETLQLRRVLSSNQARGRWGEETLRRVVEAAGMSVHCDFHEQSVAGDAKPDLIVRLPGDRSVIVDAKVPDLEALATLGEVEEARRTAVLAAHASRLRATVKELAERNYPSKFPGSLDYVVLFLPAESLFSAALEADPELIVWAARRQVMLATPASLIGLLRSISVAWMQQAQHDNARSIAMAADELFVRVNRFVEHLARIRSGLLKANAAFNDAVGSFDRMVRPSGERLRQLGGADRKTAELRSLDEPLRRAPVDGVSAISPEHPDE